MMQTLAAQNCEKKVWPNTDRSSLPVAAYLVLELVIFAHVFLVLVVCHFASTFINCAVLLKLWPVEHACEHASLCWSCIYFVQPVRFYTVSGGIPLTLKTLIDFDMSFRFGESLETRVPLRSLKSRICHSWTPVVLFLLLTVGLANILGGHRHCTRRLSAPEGPPM